MRACGPSRTRSSSTTPRPSRPIGATRSSLPAVRAQRMRTPSAVIGASPSPASRSVSRFARSGISPCRVCDSGSTSGARSRGHRLRRRPHRDPPTRPACRAPASRACARRLVPARRPARSTGTPPGGARAARRPRSRSVAPPDPVAIDRTAARGPRPDGRARRRHRRRSAIAAGRRRRRCSLSHASGEVGCRRPTGREQPPLGIEWVGEVGQPACPRPVVGGALRGEHGQLDVGRSVVDHDLRRERASDRDGIGTRPADADERTTVDGDGHTA